MSPSFEPVYLVIFFSRLKTEEKWIKEMCYLFARGTAQCSIAIEHKIVQINVGFF